MFSRVKARLSPGSTLSLILDGIKAGVSREALTDALSWVGCQLLKEDQPSTHSKDVATYFVAAHELVFLNTASHHVLIGVFQRGKTIELLSTHLAAHLFAAMCALGVGDRLLL
ncbi:hypothetical protein TraAM80_03399 [Trypanosoma rangeli]|uniref:Uncharacterized protein n=1 Tax=Trypanosoma rangeli TaxID=5698 RepID=A0A3R7NT71_TRYRA|nr:uncharacterized protein TraAM80_03399 [Trypanosoma rangeli]RNF07276.1 hypothetical protein TraAM80_03399 [Trypanosoma rangeli]|eukprot:RNF07276.1 hypothetical protein TraAM80_03399 [Trypanosoma rangeli]